jgi:hypothetical protein
MKSAKFSKLSSDDFKSRQRAVETTREFPLKLRNQNFIALNVAHRERNPSFPKAAFRLLETFDSVTDAQEKYDDDQRDFDVNIVALHEPVLLTCGNEAQPAGDVQAKIDERIKACRADYAEQSDRVNKRVAYTQHLSAQNNKNNEVHKTKHPLAAFAATSEDGTVAVEEEKMPEMPEVKDIAPAEPQEKQPMKNLDSDAIVVSVIAPLDEEPVLIVYGSFATFEDARIYAFNTLNPDFDVMVLAAGEWYLVEDLDIKKASLDSVDYFDEGLSALMDLPRNANKRTAEMKALIPEEDIICPVPDLLEPRPIIPGPARDVLVCAGVNEH